MKEKVIIKFKRKYIYILVMKLGDITKNYGDEKIEIQKHIVDAGNKSDNKKSKEKSNTSALSGIFDLKNKITKYAMGL